ncbi:DUF2231 domain-containing protein [Lewinella sp. IMCC34183]|uniref:DUF2231 domain-containing protein n=1 Tax=Lewinella sp. IMCC34183 TaxID=2248762 RepID=UPI000E283A70|nr:DUF2231 domain-containing protein [Lewinella sp. IMCC34183]
MRRLLFSGILASLFPLVAVGQQLQESSVVSPSLSELPNLHPLVVHVPIMMLVLAVVTQLASFFVWKKQLDWVTFLMLAGGVVGAFLAGEVFHPHTKGLTDAAQQTMKLHDTWADYTIWSSVVALVLKGLSLFVLAGKRWLEIVTTLVLAFSAVAVSITGHYGGTLVYIHGVGVQGNYVEAEHQK